MVKIPTVGGYFDISMVLFLSSLMFFSVTFPISSVVGAKPSIGAQKVKNSVQKNSGPKIVKKIVTQPKIVPDVAIPPVTNNIPPLVYRVPTNQPVVFLTIDDGQYKDQSVIDLLAVNHIKASIFIAHTFVGEQVDFFKKITALGSYIEDHTMTHDLWMTWHMSKPQQAAEICGMADYEQQNFGRRPVFFRPPGGSYNGATMVASGECGMRAVVTWTAEAKGGVMYYQDDTKLKAGDIVLMHFRPEFAADLQAFLDAQKAAGLKIDLLENWL